MKMFEPSQSLWWSRKQEPPCLPVQEQSAAVLALAERCYRGLPRKPSDAAPAALTLHELRVQPGTESWFLQLQAGLWQGYVWGFPTVNLLLPQPTFPISPPEYRHNHTRPVSLLLSFSSDTAHKGHSSPITSIQVPSHWDAVWQLLSLFECSGQGHSLEAEVFYWSSFHCRGSFDIHLLLQIQRELERLCNLYRPRKDHWSLL